MKLGHDIVNIERIKKQIDESNGLFIDRIYTESEIRQAPKNKKEYYYAKRFAAKEAVMKAIGPKGVAFKEIETLNYEDGKPYVNLYGKALKKLEVNEKISISLSDDFPMASAVVIIL